MLGPFQVVLLFLVLNVSKDHVGGQYISITATNPSQSDSLRTLNLSLTYLHVVLHIQYHIAGNYRMVPNFTVFADRLGAAKI